LGVPALQVRPEQIALLFVLVVALNLVLLIALQLPRLGRRFGRGPSAADAYARTFGAPIGEQGAETNAGYERQLLASSSGLPVGLYQRMARIVSFMFIGSAMVIITLTGSADATAIIVLLAFSLILIELFQDVLPVSALGRWRLPLEAVIVLIFLTVLITMTGGHDSPYFFGYVLLVGAAALSTSDLGAAILAVISSVAYIAAVLVASGSAPLESSDFGVLAFNLVSIALVMYVASVIGREQRRARDEALRLSRFDSLTSLFSRDYFMSAIDQEILRATRSGRPFALAMVDLDGLKAANDRFGHDWGDNLLKAVADVMRGDVRVTDVAARYGGDEFVLLLPETDLAGAGLVAEKVRVDISRVALPHNGAVVRTSASIGIVTFPEDGRNSAELLRRADLAMYEAKRRGRDQIVRFARDAAPAPGSAPTVVDAPAEASVSPSSNYGRAPRSFQVPRESAARPDAVPPASAGPAPWEAG
jgi:diguanylate cyclase (GGDEF)-like protein